MKDTMFSTIVFSLLLSTSTIIGIIHPAEVRACCSGGDENRVDVVKVQPSPQANISMFDSRDEEGRQRINDMYNGLSEGKILSVDSTYKSYFYRSNMDPDSILFIMTTLTSMSEPQLESFPDLYTHITSTINKSRGLSFRQHWILTNSLIHLPFERYEEFIQSLEEQKHEQSSHKFVNNLRKKIELSLRRDGINFQIPRYLLQHMYEPCF
jgi:hypothetical protein